MVVVTALTDEHGELIALNREGLEGDMRRLREYRYWVTVNDDAFSVPCPHALL